MLKIRLQRIGRKNDPAFRVVLTDSKNSAKSGKFLEILGTYNPKMGEKNLITERIKYWMSQGAKCSDTIHNFLVHDKVIEGKKINVLPKKTVPKKEETTEAPKAEAKTETKTKETVPEAEKEAKETTNEETKETQKSKLIPNQ